MTRHVADSALQMRKSPQQDRSRATVSVVVEAAGRVLGRRRWAGFTTSEVAAVAGVSIGSIYQYFQGKPMLLEAVRDQHFDMLIPLLEAVSNDNGSLEHRARLLVRGLVSAHTGEAGLHRVLLEEATVLHVSPSAERMEAAYRDAISALVAKADTGAVEEISDEVAIVLGAALEGAVHEVAKAGRQHDKAMLDALERLILSYLKPRLRQ